MSLEHINVKNTIITFRSIYSIVASVGSWLVINVEEIDYEESSSFDEGSIEVVVTNDFLLLKNLTIYKR